MLRLEIDFVRRRSRTPWAGRVLFALGVALAADTGWRWVELREALEAGQARLAEVQPRGAARHASREEVAAARETLQRLSLPWGELFAALESAASPQVALLAIEPDPRSGTVKISGDSKDYLAALTYVLNLRRAGALADVQLVRHELKSDDPQRPVSFSVSATWGVQ